MIEVQDDSVQCRYCVDGEDTGSYWIPLDEVNKENTLKLILGSHKWPKLVQPTKWSNDKPWYKNKTDFMEMPSFESLNNEIMIPDLKLGDAVLFNFKIVLIRDEIIYSFSISIVFFLSLINAFAISIDTFLINKASKVLCFLNPIRGFSSAR